MLSSRISVSVLCVYQCPRVVGKIEGEETGKREGKTEERRRKERMNLPVKLVLLSPLMSLALI